MWQRKQIVSVLQHLPQLIQSPKIEENMMEYHDAHMSTFMDYLDE